MGTSRIYAFCSAVAIMLMLLVVNAYAYERYNSGCQSCHGVFTGNTSPKGNTFPSDSKHEMHRASTEMNSECDLCHSSGDQKNPFIGSSNGTANNTGYGCVGCHGRMEDAGNDDLSAGLGAGLRQHHNNAGVTTCAGCHADADPTNYTPVGEHVLPPYYGTADTNADMPCNLVQSSKTNENWTIGDFEGLDNDGDLNYDAVDSDCAPPEPTLGDMNGDGMADWLWRNVVTGRNWLYTMNGTMIDTSQSINTESDQNWKIVGNGDYDGDGKADILWRNSATGRNWMYLMNGATIHVSQAVNTEGDLNWKIVGSGDFNGDGKSDILWRNFSTGRNWIYLMDGPSVATSEPIYWEGDQNWQVYGTGDYNGDGKSDILWRNSVTGRNWMYLMNGTAIAASIPVNTEGDQNWKIVGSGDYNGDGKSDILWRNSVTGRNWMYLMNGATIDSSLPINTESDQNWKIFGSGDYNGDGKSDILWRNTATGRNWIYLMNGSAIDASVPVNTESDQNWRIVHTY